MRISDWSSDVCSSDLAPYEAVEDMRLDVERDPSPGVRNLELDFAQRFPGRNGDDAARRGLAQGVLHQMFEHLPQPAAVAADQAEEIGRASCRERVCQYG